MMCLVGLLLLVKPIPGGALVGAAMLSLENVAELQRNHHLASSGESSKMSSFLKTDTEVVTSLATGRRKNNEKQSLQAEEEDLPKQFRPRLVKASVPQYATTG